MKHPCMSNCQIPPPTVTRISSLFKRKLLPLFALFTSMVCWKINVFSTTEARERVLYVEQGEMQTILNIPCHILGYFPGDWGHKKCAPCRILGYFSGDWVWRVFQWWWTKHISTVSQWFSTPKKWEESAQKVSFAEICCDGTRWMWWEWFGKKVVIHVQPDSCSAGSESERRNLFFSLFFFYSSALLNPSKCGFKLPAGSVFSPISWKIPFVITRKGNISKFRCSERQITFILWTFCRDWKKNCCIEDFVITAFVITRVDR